MSAHARLLELCRAHGVLAVYLFGSRASDGLNALAGERVARTSADLDIGVVFRQPNDDPLALSALQVAFEDLFDPLLVDLVALQHTDPIFQFGAISGHRVAATDSTRADEYELGVMRLAAELLPVQRRLERDLFGTTSR